MDYFGTRKAKDGQKNAMTYGVSRGEKLDVPVLDESPWVYECEVKETITTGDSTTFFCYIRNIQIDSMSPLIEKDRKELLKILE